MPAIRGLKRVHDLLRMTVQGGNMNGSDAPPASMVNKITWSRYVTLDSLIS